MRKLLNTLYVTDETAYLALDGENVVVTADDKAPLRLPLANLDNIVCLNYPGVSPALMGKCAREQKGLCFLSPQGRFLARVTGETKGNVFLRKQQLERFQDAGMRLKLIQSCIAAKLVNTRFLLHRSLRDHPERFADGELRKLAEKLAQRVADVYETENEDALRGIGVRELKRDTRRSKCRCLPMHPVRVRELKFIFVFLAGSFNADRTGKTENKRAQRHRLCALLFYSLKHGKLFGCVRLFPGLLLRIAAFGQLL